MSNNLLSIMSWRIATPNNLLTIYSHHHIHISSVDKEGGLAGQREIIYKCCTYMYWNIWTCDMVPRRPRRSMRVLGENNKQRERERERERERHETSFQLLTCILSAVKTGLQNYCDTSYSRGSVNQMWILKNSKDVLEYIQSRSLSSCNTIKTLDFSTLCTTIPHSKLKDRLRELVNCAS
jgi:hypothetical protein